MLAVFGVVVMNSRDAPIAKLLRKLAVPVDVGEALPSSIWLRDGLDLDAEVIVADHGDGCVGLFERAAVTAAELDPRQRHMRRDK
jgi:hypothetical protein